MYKKFYSVLTSTHQHQDFALVAQKRATNNPKNPWTTVTDHAMKIDMDKEISMIQRKC